MARELMAFRLPGRECLHCSLMASPATVAVWRAAVRPPRSGGQARSQVGGSSRDGRMQTKAELLGVKMPADPVRVARLNRSQAQVSPPPPWIPVLTASSFPGLHPSS